MNEKLKIYDEKMQKTIHALDTELASIRAGRANPNILNKLTVEYYGTPTPIQQVANISVPEARMIQIQPWEKKIIKDIEKAILMSDIGINPTNDGTVIRLVFPELTEERRKELVKDVKKKGEEAKVAVRNVRRDGNVAFKKLNERLKNFYRILTLAPCLTTLCKLCSNLGSLFVIKTVKLQFVKEVLREPIHAVHLIIVPRIVLLRILHQLTETTDRF